MDPMMLIPFAGMMTGIFITGAVVWGIVQIVRLRTQGSAGSQELANDVAALREQVEALHQALLEVQERIDFTERLLAQGRADLPKAT